jgi:hypothetical protein
VVEVLGDIIQCEGCSSMPASGSQSLDLADELTRCRPQIFWRCSHHHPNATPSPLLLAGPYRTAQARPGKSIGFTLAGLALTYPQ